MSKIVSFNKLRRFWSNAEAWITTNLQSLFDNDAELEKSIKSLSDSKYDKSGGAIKGNVSISGTTTFGNKVTCATNTDNKSTTLDVPGNLGMGSRTNAAVQGRINTYRKINSPSNLVAIKNSIGYNPIDNVQATYDYGMKYQVQYGDGIDNYDGCCFYLSYSNCIVGFSGDHTKRISKFYTVLHEGNAYLKEDVDIMINTLKQQNEELKHNCDVLFAALESLGVDITEIENSISERQSRMIDVIEMIQNKPRGFDVPDDYVFEQ